jgi:hypothetical protein
VFIFLCWWKRSFEEQVFIYILWCRHLADCESQYSLSQNRRSNSSSMFPWFTCTRTEGATPLTRFPDLLVKEPKERLVLWTGIIDSLIQEPRERCVAEQVFIHILRCRYLGNCESRLLLLKIEAAATL